MQKKHIILLILIALGIFRFFSSGRGGFFNFLLSIGGAVVLWGIFVWGYDNPEEKSSK